MASVHSPLTEEHAADEDDHDPYPEVAGAFVVVREPLRLGPERCLVGVRLPAALVQGLAGSGRDTGWKGVKEVDKYTVDAIGTNYS